jgi:hypothetical protein
MNSSLNPQKPMQKSIFSLALILSAVFCGVSQAGFLVFADPNDLLFNGPGAHAVDIQVRHDGTGLSTLSGYTIRFGSSANASLGVLPAGVSATSAVIGLALPATQLFGLDTSTNSVAGSSLGGDANVGVGGTATLFTLNLNLGGAPTYTIGVDVQNAQRGGLFASEIASEFNAASPTTDFSFSLALAAIPEPTSLSLLIGSMGIAVLSRRRR